MDDAQVSIVNVDVERLREQFLNHEFDAKTFDVTAEAIIRFARACGEGAARYLQADHPNFQAPPTFPSSLMTNRQVPVDFPSLNALSMNGGKSMEFKRPVRPGKIVGRSHLNDIYEKTGRSGRMLFVVSRMEFFDEGGDLLTVSDSRQIFREKPHEG
jgi:hypothetical protein